MTNLQPTASVSRHGCRTLVDVLERAARLYGDREIIHVSPVDASESKQTYAALAADARSIAALLLSKGWRPGEPLLFVVTSSPLFSTLFWGCQLAGVVPVPLAALPGKSLDNMEAEKIRNVARATAAPLLFDSRQDQYADLMMALAASAGSHVVAADEILREARLGHFEAPDLPLPDEEDLAVLQFSSGSSGQPKGVRLTHRNIIANIDAQLDFTAATPDDVLCTWLPYFHDFGLFWGHLSALYHGMTQVRIDPGHFARRPLLWLEKIQEHRASLTNTTPTALEHLIGFLELKQRKGAVGSYDLSCLRSMLIGAEMIDPRACRKALDLLRPFGVPETLFLSGYGLTETTVVASAVAAGSALRTRVVDRHRLVTTGEVVDAEETAQTAAEFTSCGPAVAMCQIRIVDRDGAPLGPNRAGVVEIRGENVTSGYAENEDANKASFRDGWFNSGDIGFLDSDAHLYIVGREKEMIIVGGHNYYPWDIEQIAFKARPEIEEAIRFITICGFWNPDLSREEIALFYVPQRVPEERIAEALDAMDRAVNEVAGFPIDSHVRLRTREVPRTSSGKVMRRVLTEHLVTGRLQRDEGSRAAKEATKPRRRDWSEAELRDVLRTLWSQALGVPGSEIAPETSLFHLGCNSIKASQIQGLLEETLQQRLETNFNYAYPVLESQVQHLLARDLSVEPPENEVELILRTVVHDVLGLEEADIGVTQQLSKLASGVGEAARLLAEIKRVFTLSDELAESLSGNTIRDLAGEIAAGLELGKADASTFPLMNFQETLYFHRKGMVRNEPSRLSCFIFITLDLTGDIDPPRLNRAFDLVIAKHEMLRGVIDESRDRPHLRILPQVPPFEVRYEALNGLTAEQEAAFLLSRGRALNDVRFDIGTWPLFLCEVWRKANGEHAFLFNIDHLLIDGYSFMHLLQEVFQAYDAVTEDRAFPDDQLALQFRDYVLIEQIRQRTRSYQQAMAYQLSLFQNLPPKALLPFKCDPATIEDVWFDTVFHKLPAEDMARLVALAGRNQVTLNSLLLAVWFKLVNLWSNQGDLIINMPVFNREQYFGGARDVMGTFIDIFPVRVKTESTEPVIEIAKKVERFTRELLSTPVSSIELSRLIAERDQSAAGSMSSLIFSNSIGVYGGEFDRLEKLRVANPWFRTGAPGTFIDLVLYDYEGEFYVNWNYVRGLMDRDFVETLAGQFQSICSELANADTEDGAQGAFAPASLLPAGFAQLTADLNDRVVDYPVSTIQAEIVAQAKRSPQAPALHFQNREVRYGELLEEANRVAALLKSQGVTRNSFVALMLDRSVDMLVAQLGVLQAGAAYVPIDPDYPPDRIAYVLDDCRATVLMLQQQFLDRIPEAADHLQALVVLDGTPTPGPWRRFGPEDIARSACDAPTDPSGPDDLAYMIYTSGSTGQPKGVMIRHRNILNFLHWVGQYYRLSPEDRVAFVTSYAFDMTLATNWTPLMRGASLHILDEPSTRDVETLLGFLSEQKITFLNVTPSHFSLLANARAHLDLGPLPMAPNLRVMLGGEVINTKDLNAWLDIYPSHRFINEYGPTEVSVASTFYPIPTNAEGRIDLDVVPIGLPLSNNRIYVLDRWGQPCMPGVAGELCLGGVGVAAGYFNKPERTAKAFVPDPFVGGEAMMYRTGDMARVRADGNVEFLGREDHQINLRGYRIEAGEVEHAMRQHPAVGQAVVVTQADPAGQQQLVGFYTAPDTEASVAALREAVAAQLPTHMVPALWMQLDKLPTTASGKLDHKSLPRVHPSAEAAEFVAPKSDLERRVAAAWQEVLGLAQVGADDNFWELGGNSLTAMRLIVLYREIGLEGFGLRDVFDYETVEETARFFEEGRRRDSDDTGVLSVLRRDAAAQARFLLLPFACGNASSFVELARYLEGPSEILAANPDEPDGEGTLSIADLGQRIVAALHEMPPLPLFVMGYSYGGYLAYEVVRRLELAGRPAQSVVLVASTPPGVRGELDLIIRSSDEELLAYSRELYDFDASQLSEQDTARYLHLLREQTRTMEDYRFEPDRRLATPALILVGENEEDRELAQESHRWFPLFEQGEAGQLPGRHMLIKTHPADLAERLNGLVSSLLKSSAPPLVAE